ncbi:beta-1,3-glucanase family protein [Amycolatopsis pigmentata]|uniref:Beta-1,3-glucanase family protein n=1 Tax=Amycolatopsis pigmentata TaxID=450801 RepID=A0ABW5FTH0_9PSEU
MLSRRSFLVLSAASVTVAGLSRFPAASAAPSAFTLRLTDNSGSGGSFAYVTGTSADNRLVLLRSDGSPYYPSSPSSPQTPLPVDCAIPLPNQITVPRMSAARLYVVTGGARLDFYLNPGPALVHPSFLNTSDTNYGKDFSFAEFTFNDAGLYANISYVDLVGPPIGLDLTAASVPEQSVAGLPAGSVDGIAADLAAVGGPWGGLVQKRSDGRNLRVIAAHHKAGDFAGYLDGYIDAVWQRYSGTTLTVDSQNPGLGSFTGRVSGGVLTFDNGESFGKPVTADVLSCDTGPFAIPQGSSAARIAIVPRLAAAFNRTTLLDNPVQPTAEDPAKFYRNSVTNHYARVVHARLPGNRGYAFPYDDVTPGPDFSGAVYAQDPQVLTVTVSATR